MPNLTPNYSWNLPLVNNATDADLWGGQLNSNFSDLDTELKAVSDATLLPVGSIYMNYSDSTNPGTLLGYGTWTAITDKFVVARGGTYTGTGGAATVTLVQNQLPATLTGLTTTVASPDAAQTQRLAASDNGSPRTATVTINNPGGGQSFSIIPPYQAVYMWYRSV